jgi:hypothetical protein
MARKASQVQPNPLDPLEPGPGDYHCAALSGPPPHTAASPAFSILGKHRLGKTRLQQLLGSKLAALGGIMAGGFTVCGGNQDGQTASYTCISCTAALAACTVTCLSWLCTQRQQVVRSCCCQLLTVTVHIGTQICCFIESSVARTE